MEAKFDLERVRKLIASGIDAHEFSHKKALRPVVENLQKTNSEAKSFILDQVSILTVNNFSESILINGYVYDIYGKRIEKINWYIKFSIMEEEANEFLYCISFHPIIKTIKTNIGILKP